MDDVSDPTRRRQRRDMRRSSPDAPQGIVPVVVVVVAMVVVIALTAGSLRSAGGDDHTSTAKQGAARSHRSVDRGHSDAWPTTTLIYGETTMFVATTTPYTTTSSTTTTTTTPKESSLSVRPTSVAFSSGSTSASLTVRTTSSTSVTYFVVGLPDGISASPTSGRVTRAKSATVTLHLDDPVGAQSGVFTVVGSDGSQIRVPVEIPGSSFAVGAVTLQPSPPRCNQPTQITVTISGDVAGQVSVQLDTSGNGSTTLALLAIGDGTWLGTLPAAPTGSTVSGNVVATSTSGRTAQQSFSATVVGGHTC